MTTKTLGQVLYEADAFAFGPPDVPLPYGEMPECDRVEYERIAQAVAAVVREQCAQEARAHHRRMRAAAALRPLHVTEWDAYEAIRNMNP